MCGRNPMAYANNNTPVIDRPSASKAFRPGKSYATRSICDHDCWMRVTVLSRTAKTVTTNRSVHRVSFYEGVEQIKPWGNYSMCAIIGADDEGRGQ
jgi:hypothetical protein